jgi:hypothetical protein
MSDGGRDVAVRKISQAKWLADGVPWLTKGEVCADALIDLRTKDCKISLYRCANDHDNIRRVVAALGAAGNCLAHCDYALIPVQMLKDLGLKWKESEGGTPCSEVNEWHIDLVELTVKGIHDLAHGIQYSCERKRAQRLNVKCWILEEVESGEMDLARIDPKMCEALGLAV